MGFREDIGAITGGDPEGMVKIKFINSSGKRLTVHMTTVGPYSKGKVVRLPAYLALGYCQEGSAVVVGK
jgi:hypothetical protein